MAADLAGDFATSLRGMAVCVAGLGVSGPPAARALAEPGDTVPLEPAAQSFDMFRDYLARGDAFADAVRRPAAAQ